MNKKGFTMVELLVAMAIMGLLIIMAFPTIRAIRANNTETKYEEYGRSAISAAKLYVDSYAEDIFDPEKNSQYVSINLNKIREKDLLKDINVSDSNCIDNSSVRVVKYNDDYDYCLNLHCKSGEQEVYTEVDRKGSCKNFDSKIKHVFYRYKNYEPYSVEVFVGDDNYQLLDPSRMTQFNFNINQENFIGWTLDSTPDASSTTYKKGSIYPNKINDDITFYANTEKWKYKINYKKNSDGTYNGTMDSTECRCGSSCPLRDLGFSRVGYHFRNWQRDSNTTFTNKENVKSGIGDTIKYDGEQVNLTGIFDINVCTVTYSPNGGTFGNNASSTVQKQNYNTYYGDATDGMRNANGGFYNATRSGFHIDAATAWAGGKNGAYDERRRYLAQEVCDLSSGNKSVTLNANWKMNKPNKPSISNPTNGNWTNKNINLGLSTNTPSNIIGKWYYTYDKNNFGELKDSNNASVTGRTSFTSDPFTAERNQDVYIRVCNKNASGPKDDTNCSNYADTPIRIDKTPPILWTRRARGTGGGTWVISSGCSGWSWVKDYCYTHYGSTWAWEYENDFTCTDEGGSGCSNYREVIWNHNGSSSAKCGSSGNYVNSANCGFTCGSGLCTWIDQYSRYRDNAGNTTVLHLFQEVTYY